MFAVTDIKEAPWYVVDAENKKCARLNVIRHLLSLFPYRDLTPERLKLPSLDKSKYVRPPIQEQNFIPQVYSSGGVGKGSSDVGAQRRVSEVSLFPPPRIS
jgi:hypothetical protein